MIDIHQALKKAKKLDFSVWRRLALLCLGAFLLGFSTSFLEVGSVSFFLQKNTFHAIGVDFLAVALCLVWVGSCPKSRTILARFLRVATGITGFNLIAAVPGRSE